MNNSKQPTQQKKVYARWSMKVTFKSEFQRPRHSTGEMIESWTYRSDLVVKEFEKRNQVFQTPLHALAAKLFMIQHKCSEVQVFDNALPPSQQLLFHSLNGQELFNRKKSSL